MDDNCLCAWPEPEWEHVGSLEVELRRSWLLYETHLTEVHLDMFSERGPTRPPESFGRVYVPEVEESMLPPWNRAFSTPAFTETGTCCCKADVDPCLHFSQAAAACLCLRQHKQAWSQPLGTIEFLRQREIACTLPLFNMYIADNTTCCLCSGWVSAMTAVLSHPDFLWVKGSWRQCLMV